MFDEIIKTIINLYINDNENIIVTCSDKPSNINMAYFAKNSKKSIVYVLRIKEKSIVNGNTYISLSKGTLYEKSEILENHYFPTLSDYKRNPKIINKQFASIEEMVKYLKELIGDEKYGMLIVKLMFKFPALNIQHLI